MCFLASSWSEGCLIAPIAEEKVFPIVELRRERYQAQPRHNRVPAFVSSIFKPSLRSPPPTLHNSSHNDAAADALLIVALQDVTQMVSRLRRKGKSIWKQKRSTTRCSDVVQIDAKNARTNAQTLQSKTPAVQLL